MHLHRDKLQNGVTIVRGIQRGMIFWATLPPPATIGSEQHSDPARPWLVLSNDRLHQKRSIVLAAPLTSQMQQHDKLPQARIRIPTGEVTRLAPTLGETPLTGDDQLVLTEQLRVLAHERLGIGPIAVVTAVGLAYVEAGLKHVLDLG